MIDRKLTYLSNSEGANIMRYRSEKELDWDFDYNEVYKHHDYLPAFCYNVIDKHPTAYYYYYYGERHNYIGPSVSQYQFTNPTYRWYIHGTRVIEEEYFAFLDQNNMDINNLTDGDKLLISMGG